MLPTVEKIRDRAVRAGLRLIGQQSFGESYARTLAAWRERFLASWPATGQLGFDARFKRMWEYYLCYCEAGFRTGAIDVGFYKFRPAQGPVLSSAHPAYKEARFPRRYGQRPWRPFVAAKKHRRRMEL
jgi:hypothetical protein